MVRKNNHKEENESSCHWMWERERSGRENGKRERFLVREIGFINCVKSSYLILPGLCYSCLNKSFLCSKNIIHFFKFFYSYIFPKKITLLKISYQTGQITAIILHVISQKYIYVHIYLICVSYCNWLLITIIWTHHFLSTIYNLPTRQLWHKFYYFMWF